MFQINLSKKFSSLLDAPIVEAVLHWQAMASIELESQELESQLKSKFCEYVIEPKYKYNFEMAIAESPADMKLKQSAAWEGFRLTKVKNETPVFVCQFGPDGIVFSQLAPYLGWPDFEKEALRFWSCFVELGKPHEISKLSTRYISQISINNQNKVDDFIDISPEPFQALGLLSKSFAHHNTIKLLDHPYVINLVRALQPGQPSESLIVDIDVAATNSITSFGTLPNKLKELRFIKNKLFFALMKNPKSNFGGSH